MKYQDVSVADRRALEEAARVERAARQSWDAALHRLMRLIKQASRNGASLRAIATTIDRSHGRVRELLNKATEVKAR
jgi:hypothetical protein